MKKSLTLVFEENPKQEELEFIGQNLSKFNRDCAGEDDFKPLNIFLRDADGSLVGGFIGATYWHWLYVDVLWVEEASRSRGHGQQLLHAAEQEAMRRGCKFAFLDTFSFQAPEFYKQRGYEVFGELPDFPAGQSRYFLKKALR